MTREEAIDVLKNWDGYFIGHSSDEVTEALDRAIKALKAMSQIYKITDGYAEALYQSDTAFDGVASVLTDYFKVVEE